jgi:hypothetical protein
MSRAFSSLAISFRDSAPVALMSSITGARSAARAFADADRTCRALAQSAAVPGRPRKPPRLGWRRRVPDKKLTARIKAMCSLDNQKANGLSCLFVIAHTAAEIADPGY